MAFIRLGYYQLSLKKAGMIRINQPGGAKRIQQMHYRNASYQGEIKGSHFDGGGLVYFHEGDHLVACKSFYQSHIDGSAFFVYDRSNYWFGEWTNNRPNGISVFRIRDTVIGAQYKGGSIVEGSNAFILLEAHNVGVIAQIRNGDQWEIRQKSEVYCLEQIEEIVSKCNFSCKQVQLSLFRFISHRLNVPPFRLRIIGNDSYVFGFEDGLSLYFDEQERIAQIQTNKVRPPLDRPRGSPIKVGQVYNNSLLMAEGPHFRNKALKDPSKSYFDQLANMLDQGMIKAILSGFIMDPTVLSKSRKSALENSLIIKSDPTKQNQKTYPSPKASEKNQSRFDFKDSHSRLDSKCDEPSRLAGQRATTATKIGAPLFSSKFIRQPVKLYSFHQSPPKRPSNIEPFQLRPTFQIIQAKNRQEEIQIIQRSPETSSKTQEASLIKKNKRKIFDLVSGKGQTKNQVSPKRGREGSQSRSRNHRIFTPNETKLQFSEMKEDDSSIKKRPSSPIHDLRSEALKTQKSKDDFVDRQDKQQSQKIQPSPSNNRRLRREHSGKKRALTQFGNESGIVGEDMSNLLDLNDSSGIQLNESPAKKLKRHNDIYRGEGKQYKIVRTKEKANDNSPYLALPSKVQFTRSHAAATRIMANPNGPLEKRYNVL